MPKEKFFTDTDFDKQLSIGDSLVFDKADLRILRIELSWYGTDLDVCAFMLDKDKELPSKDSLVFYNSNLRWKTTHPFDSEEFNPLKGTVSEWDENGPYKNRHKWLLNTLPLSPDGSVIGSWDDASEEDDDNQECQEVMHVLLDEIDQRRYDSIILAAAVAKKQILKGERFQDAKTPIVKIYNADNDELLAEYRLDQEFPGKDVVCFGEVKLTPNRMFWTFNPLAESYNGGIERLAREVF
ncbi:MAG: TerD family protein [Bacteroidaceae bacterium]|nr:TerD family protein [Bacteroidaceae bacterium]